MCRNPKLWIVLGVVAVAAAIAVPNAGAVLPLLLVAACPLMMLVMMVGGMAGLGRGRRNEEATATPDADEVAQLRAEVAELRERAGH